MENNEALKEQQVSLAGPWAILALCVIYLISPIDIIPDVPVVGQIDDIIILLSGGLNLLQKYLEKWDSAFAGIVKGFKWIVILLGVIVILLLALCTAAIISLFTK